jgi:hypothetical protein
MTRLTASQPTVPSTDYFGDAGGSLFKKQVIPTCSFVGCFDRDRLRRIEAGATPNSKNYIGVE